jgi:hypothetical protein
MVSGMKVFEKITVGGIFFLIQQPSLILSKTFLPENLRTYNTNLTRKTDWKKVENF